MKLALRITPWVIIVLILSWVYLVRPSYQQHRASAILMHLRQIDTIMYLYIQDHGKYPESIDSLLSIMREEDRMQITDTDWYRSMRYYRPDIWDGKLSDRIILLVPYHRGALVVNQNNQREWIRN